MPATEQERAAGLEASTRGRRNRRQEIEAGRMDVDMTGTAVGAVPARRRICTACTSYQSIHAAGPRSLAAVPAAAR